ncbi:ABC transporter permease [Alkaliphilus peptidifermentans]|uniref:Putative ABC transport system permease protein n=1 Tax=Alkaliphilus peptidifermentans DSM 18978 TaxID=1120976 RepID=A0A1G5J3W5_9FIRM|nr:iron export ABC transporter permease subunit FetB [Alkaliphilus peptidifermentans]SCY83046.1 putative ABC transport system permease protein [Alkaliphilus peptidifermentans DSM 18978]
MSILTLSLTTILVFIALIISKTQKIQLEKDIIIGVIRATLQLSFIGIVLTYIFSAANWLITTILLLVMIFNASQIAAKRGGRIKGGKLTAFISIFMGASITIMILVLTKAISYHPSEVIPVSGMIVGNAMVALGLTFKQLHQNFKNKYQEVEIKLSLGATERSASIDLIRDSIRTGMQPTVDAMQTLGIVQLPGMMTGLILAGLSPVMAIRYQIMVTFMLLSTVAIATFIGTLISYKKYFNDRRQLNKSMI